MEENDGRHQVGRYTKALTTPSSIAKCEICGGHFRVLGKHKEKQRSGEEAGSEAKLPYNCRLCAR